LSAGPFAREWAIFENIEQVIETWLATVARIAGLGVIIPDPMLPRWLRQTETIVFEGAQGVLLDADAGFHPYTTWSRCTAENARELIADIMPATDIFSIGVMRSMAVRHGPGPLPTETELLMALVSEHNCHNEWQGPVRYGWFDAVLARYALRVTGPLDALMITHLDLLARLKEWKYCNAYLRKDETLLADLEIQRGYSLTQRAQLSQELMNVKPILETGNSDPGQVIASIEALTGHSIGLVSRGPSFGDVQLLQRLP
jgi:adenylosuccinate synthase